MILYSLVAKHSGLLSHAAARGVGRHGGRGMSAAAMVGGCIVYLFLPRYIACHVSAVQKILSMQHPVYFLCRLPKNLVQKNLRVLHFTQRNPFQKKYE